MDGEIRKEQQDDGSRDSRREQPDGQRLCLGYLPLLLHESLLRLPVKFGYQPVQLGVQPPAQCAQAVGVCLHFRRPFLLHGYQAVAELVQFLGGGQHLHGLFAAESPGDTFLFLLHCTDACRPPCHFGQMVYQETIRLILLFYCIHNMP